MRRLVPRRRAGEEQKREGGKGWRQHEGGALRVTVLGSRRSPWGWRTWYLVPGIPGTWYTLYTWYLGKRSSVTKERFSNIRSGAVVR